MASLTGRHVRTMFVLGIATLFVVEFFKLTTLMEDEFEVEESNEETGTGNDVTMTRKIAEIKPVAGDVTHQHLENKDSLGESVQVDEQLERLKKIPDDGDGKKERPGKEGQKPKMEKPPSLIIPKVNDDDNHRADPDSEIFINTSRPVLNPHPFQYLINAPDLCKGRQIFLLCYVHTAISHVNRRKRIRQTWGKSSNYPDVEIQVVFFVGLPNITTNDGRLHMDYLKFESKRYGDIVQEDYLDTYQNLSHKGVGALKWVTTYCNHTKYVLKTDDDMFVNMYIILNHLRNLFAATYTRRLMMCYVFWLMHVDRSGGQWSLTKDYFPDDLYPPYCSGMGFVASTDVAIAMYRVSPYVRFLWVDDAFISGVLPAALGGAVNHTSWARTYCGAFEMGVYTHQTEWYKYTFTHVHNETLYRLTWEGLSKIARNKTIPRPSVIRPGHLADRYIPLSSMFSVPKR